MWSLALSKLDPFVAQLPAKWQNDPELEPWLRYLNRWLEAAYIKMGGGQDLITNITNSESFETSSSASEAQDNFDFNGQIEDYIIIPEPIEDQYEDFIISEPVDQEEHNYTPAKEFTAKIATSAYTAVDHDFVEGRNGVTIKLDANASYNDQVITGNGDSTVIKVDGNGIELRHKGQRGTTINIRSEGTSIHWFLFVADRNGSVEKYWRSS